MTSSIVLHARRGMSAIPFIIMLILFLAAVGAAYSFYNEREELRVQVDSAKQRESVERTRAISAEQLNKQVAEVVGYNSTEDANDPVNVAAVRDAIAAIKSRFAPGEAESALESRMPALSINDGDTLEQVIGQLEQGIIDTVAKVKEQEGIVAAKESEIAGLQQEVTNVEATLEERIEEVTGQRESVERERDDAVDRADREASEAKEQINDLRDRSEDERRELAAEKRGLEEQVRRKEIDLTKLRQKEEIVAARRAEFDGKVIEIDVRRNVAMINRGRQDGLRLGTRFDVIRVVHDTEEYLMGTIEVRETFEDYAVCNVVDVADPSNLPMPGDQIRNEIYDRKRVREFAFAGSVSNSRFSREEIGEMIKQFGGRLVDETDVTTDIIVLGAGYDSSDNYKRGQELQIETMPENELLRQLGR